MRKGEEKGRAREGEGEYWQVKSSMELKTEKGRISPFRFPIKQCFMKRE